MLSQIAHKVTATVKHITIKDFIFLLLGICTGYILFYNLGKYPLENWDEAWYGDMVRNMLYNHNFSVLYWNKAPYFDKPPLYIWISVFWAFFFGLNEFTLRLTSAMSAFIIITGITLYSYKKFGLLPSLLAFSTIAFNNIFIWRARSGNLDLLVALLIFMSFFVIQSKSKKRYILLGVLFGLTYLAKTAIVSLPLGIFILHDLLFRRKELKKEWKYIVLSIFVMLLMIATWLFFGYLQAGKDFVNYYLFQSDQGVSKMSFSNFKWDYLRYAYYSLQRRFFIVFLIGLFFALFSIRKPHSLLLILFSTLLIIQLSFTQRSNNWYLIPAMPFWSMLIAYGTYRVINFFKGKIKIAVIVIVSFLSLYVSYRTYTVNITSLYNATSVTKLVESAKAINEITQPTDVIMRLDDLYPTTIYYSERKVVPRTFYEDFQIAQTIKINKIHWLAGTTHDMETFLKEYNLTPKKNIQVNDEEVLVQI